MTKLYEVMLLFRSEIEIYKKSLEAVHEKVKELGGYVDKEAFIGSQVLAYTIAKQSKGCYHLMNIKLNTEKVKALDLELKLIDGLIRSLIIVK